MINPNGPPPVQDQDYQPDPLDQPVQPGQEAAIDLELAEILIASQSQVLEIELVMMGGGLAVSALLDQLDE